MTARTVEHYRTLPYRRRVEPRRGETGAYFLAWIEELPSIEIHGKTREQALERLDEIFDDCIEAMIEAGDEIPEPSFWPSGLFGRAAQKNLRRLQKSRLPEHTAQSASSERRERSDHLRPWERGESPTGEMANV